MDGQLDCRMAVAWSDEQLDAQMLTVGQLEARTDGQMDAWTGGRSKAWTICQGEYNWDIRIKGWYCKRQLVFTGLFSEKLHNIHNTYEIHVTTNVNSDIKVVCNRYENRARVYNIIISTLISY